MNYLIDRADILGKLSHAIFMNDNWEEGAEIFEQLDEVGIRMLSGSTVERPESTILHEAIQKCQSVSVIQRIINQILNKVPNHHACEILRVKNEQGNTPLHVAASSGSPATCHAVIGALRRCRQRGGDDDSSSSLKIVSSSHHEEGEEGEGEDEKEVRLALYDVNNEGETPMFIAASHGHKRTFLLLYSLSRKCRMPLKRQLRRDKDGDTLLHSTLRNQYFELSLLIIQKLYPEVPFHLLKNNQQETPLDILASYPSAYVSRNHLSLWQNLCYYFTNVKKPKLDDDHQIHVVDIESCKDEIPEAARHDQIIHSRPGSIREMKEKHQWCKVILEELIKANEGSDYLNRVLSYFRNAEDETVFKEREKNPVFTAIRYGMMDLVETMVKKVPSSIYYETLSKRNIVHVAVEERQTHILKELLMKHRLWFKLREAVDDDGNNALHLVAKLSTRTPSKIQASAMHLQWEVKWLQFVEGIMPSYFSSHKNKGGQTPSELFAKEHETLIKDSNQWVKDTSTSYTVASTVIASMTFPACYQLPGGTDSNTGQAALAGKPHEKTLDKYLLTIQLAFYFSITSMAIFLALYSSRKRASDYALKLPLALVFGLTALLVSLVSTLVSFSTAISLALQSPRNPNPSPWYYLLLIPLFFYILPTIPFYFALLTASLKKEPYPKYVGENVPL